MLELVASLVVDLSDQRLTVYNSDQEVVGEVDQKAGDELKHGGGRDSARPSYLN